jgi:hypothetical protein
MAPYRRGNGLLAWYELEMLVPIMWLYAGCQKPDQAAISIETRAATQQP